MKNFLKHLETIALDIAKGFEMAAPIVAEFIPGVGPVLTEIAAIVNKLESIGSNVTPAQLSQIIQAIAMTSAVKQSVATTAPVVTTAVQTTTVQ